MKIKTLVALVNVYLDNLIYRYITIYPDIELSGMIASLHAPRHTTGSFQNPHNLEDIHNSLQSCHQHATCFSDPLTIGDKKPKESKGYIQKRGSFISRPLETKRWMFSVKNIPTPCWPLPIEHSYGCYGT